MIMGKDNNIEKCDILITYEIRNREIENLCLIKRELERRGYKVLFRMQYGTFFDTEKPVDAKVVVIPAYYRERAKFYAASHTPQVNKLVNLQWEQVFSTTNEDNPDFLGSIKPWGRSAVHFSWGNQMHERLMKQWGVKEDHAPVIGHVALDFLRGPLRNYYMSREELFMKYNIPSNKKVHLFISSLSFVGGDKHVIKMSGNKNELHTAELLADISINTRKALMDWFEKALSESEDDIIIYRPHPEETNCTELNELASRVKNFYVISQESVKQWVLACDMIYNWMSTSVAEVYAAGKGCALLRPVEIPYELEFRLFIGAPFITTYEDFYTEFRKSEQSMPIPEETISNYYKIDKDKYSYKLACDMIEKVLKDDSYNLEEPLTNPFRKGGIFNKHRVGNFIKRCVASSSLMNKIHNGNAFKNTTFRELLDNVYYVKEKFERNYVPDEEINQIVSRIDAALNSEGGVSDL